MTNKQVGYWFSHNRTLESRLEMFIKLNQSRYSAHSRFALYRNSDIYDTAHTMRGSTQQKKGQNKRAVFLGLLRTVSVRLCSKCLFGCRTMAPATKNNTTTSTAMDLLFLDVIVWSADTGLTGHNPLPLAMQPPLIFNGISESSKSFCKGFKSTFVLEGCVYACSSRKRLSEEENPLISRS